MDFEAQLAHIGEYGIVEEVKHPICVVSGLYGARLNELVLFETGEMGEVFLLDADKVEILVLTKEAVRVGSRVTRMDKFLSVPVGDSLLGAMINPLGDSITNKAYTKPKEEREIDPEPLGISYRTKVRNPLLTGTALVDMMIPLGKGQKELVIGDRKTGKTSFLMTAIKNQVQQGAVGIYAAIGRRKSDIKKVQAFFDKEGLTDKTIIVATNSFDSPSLTYLTPYSAMTIAEYFRDKGQDVFVVFDDLSAHAKFYREVSLLARRFPGRESYPGDIFYVHGKLMERTGNYLINGKEVSISSLPVAELVEGDFTGYIATNLMGMTDGHIFFDSNMYYRGRRPAINISLSVTRVGRQAQSPLVRSINRELTAFLALYEKMQNLSHFGAELTDTVKNVLEMGEIVYRFFEQHYTVVIPLPVQLVLLALLWLKMLDETSLDAITEYRTNLMNAYKDSANKQLFEQLIQEQSFNDFLGAVAKQKDTLLAICKTKTK